MTSFTKTVLLSISHLLFFLSASSQAPAFNQNSSRSNNRNPLQPGFNFQLTPQYAVNLKDAATDSLFFRGNGTGLKMNTGYSFGSFGIGLTSGFLNSETDPTKINEFISRTGVPADQLTINSGNQQNMYVLFGPFAEFGKKIRAGFHAKGGLFINNSGFVNIQRKGAVNSLYRNEPSSKSVFPGFNAGINLHYDISNALSVGFGTDYMSTKSEVVNYDIRRGAAIEGLKLSKNISNVLAGISIRYNIRTSREAGSGMATGKHISNVKYEDIKARESGSGMATGKTYQPGQPTYGNLTAKDNCGPVTKKIINPDGTTEEMIFACPDDAAAYNSKMNINGGMPNRISMNVTVPKQTQGAAFGEKVNAGLHAAGSALGNGASICIISGRLTWGSSGERMGIITNRTLMAGTTSMSGAAGNNAVINGGTPRGGSTTMNSQTSSTKQTNQSSFGTLVRLSAREAGSGMATGRRSREAGSGMATGRRQYEPVFSEGQGDVCNTCLATAKMSGAQSNPIYSDKGLTGENPFYEGYKRTAAGEDEDCDGVAEADIFLIDAGSGAVIAKTKTEQCGDFFFANVPEGDYVVKVSGSFTCKKGYDVYLNPKAIGSKTDLRGGVTAADDWDVQLLINTSSGNDEMTQKAGISTSRSNIRNRTLTIIEADLDGDGKYESLRATGTFSDGSTQDITSAARKTISNASGTKGIVLEGNALKMRRRVEVLKSNKQGDPDTKSITSISVITGNRLTATGTFSDGSTLDITEALSANTDHQGVKQYSITVSDLDDDGIADAVIKTKTKSNQSNDRMAIEDAEDDNGLINAKAKITKSRSNIQNNRMINDGEGDNIWSPRSNIKILRLATGDLDGDGTPEMTVAAPFVPGGSVITAGMRRPGEPIPGIDVKLGKNPGGQYLQSTASNANGEFEFSNLEAGDYRFIIEQKIFIEDETFVSLGGNNTRAQDHNSSRSNKTGSIVSSGQDNGNTKAQDHNSSRSNKTGSIISGGQDNDNTKAQDHNSSRSNKSASVIDNDPDNSDAGDKKNNTGPLKWMAPEALQRMVNTIRSNIKNILVSLDALEEQLDADASNERFLVNTSRSNIKNQRMAVYALQETLANMQYMEKETAMNELNKKTTVMNRQFLTLQESIKAMGNQYTTVSNVLKTRHESAMSSIRNMK